MKNILDLRFIIGLFFTLTGLLLLVGSFLMQADVGKSETPNFWSSIVYIAFGLLMIVLWLVGKNKIEADDDGEVTEPPLT